MFALGAPTECLQGGTPPKNDPFTGGYAPGDRCVTEWCCGVHSKLGERSCFANGCGSCRVTIEDDARTHKAAVKAVRVLGRCNSIEDFADYCGVLCPALADVHIGTETSMK